MEEMKDSRCNRCSVCEKGKKVSRGKFYVLVAYSGNGEGV
jgi:hypothetical protein